MKNDQQNQGQSGAERDALAVLTEVLTRDPLSQDAHPPAFANTRIADDYRDGVYTTRLDAEIEDIFQSLAPSVEEQHPPTIAVTDSTTLAHLNALVLIQNGEALPILDIERLDVPLSKKQRIRLYSATAKTLLGAIAAILEDKAAAQQRPLDNDDDAQGEGVLC